MLKIALNANFKEGNATLMMLNVEKRYRQRFFISSLLWEIGVKKFDAWEKESFQMHVAIMWTINDFPAYANLSG